VRYKNSAFLLLALLVQALPASAKSSMAGTSGAQFLKLLAVDAEGRRRTCFQALEADFDAALVTETVLDTGDAFPATSTEDTSYSYVVAGDSPTTSEYASVALPFVLSCVAIYTPFLYISYPFTSVSASVDADHERSTRFVQFDTAVKFCGMVGGVLSVSR